MQTKPKSVKIAAWSLAALSIVTLAARLSLSPLTVAAINDWFEAQGMESGIADLSFDLSDGRLTLTGLAARAQGEPVLSLGRAQIAWSWSGIFDRHLRLDSILIDGLDLDVVRGEAGEMTIAGITVPAAAAEDQGGASAAPGEPIEWSLQLLRFEMNDTRLCYRGPPRLDYCNTLAKLAWSGKLGMDLAELDAGALPLHADGEFRLIAFESRSNELNRVLASFDSLAFESVAIATDREIAVARITLERLDLFERESPDDSAYIEHLDSLQIEQTRLEDGRRLSVADILVLGNATDLVKSEADRYELDAWLAALGQATGGDEAASVSAPANDDSDAKQPLAGTRRLGEEPTPDAGQEAAESEQATAEHKPRAAGSFNFAVNRFSLRSERPLQYRDLSLDKPFVVGVSATELVVENLDSREPDKPSPISYQAKLDGDSLFTLKGSVTPLAAKISFDIAGEIRAFDLRRLSPFTASSVGHTIRSGQLDADLELKAEQAVMNGQVNLVLYHFDLAALSEADAAAMEAEFGFPLGTSLALLKNREGNIELEVPLSGSLDNPDFGTGKIISRELSKAITSAVLTFYTPFGLITAADALFSLATALRFDPLDFAVGRSELDASSSGELDKIAALMLERPGIQLRLCPHSNSADREALLPDTAKSGAAEVTLEGAQLAAMIELGEARFIAIENYLEAKQVEPSRIVPCAPQHAEGEGLSGVEISI